MFKASGLDVVSVDRQGDEVFITGRKNVEHTLKGPYPLPSKISDPYKIDENNLEACVEFVKRTKRGDIGVVANTVRQVGPRKVLAVGSGAAEFASAVQDQCEKIHVVEFNAQDSHPDKGNVSFVKASLDSLPFADNSFDTVVSFWTLHYSASPDTVLNELIRVAGPAATIVLIQAAPNNDLMTLVNDVMQETNASKAFHHGMFLHVAEDQLKNAGFRKFEYIPIPDGHLDFTDIKDSNERVNTATQLLVDTWAVDGLRKEAARKELAIRLKALFEEKGGVIGNQGAMLVAKRN